MTEPIEPGGSIPAPVNTHGEGNSVASTSMTASRALAAPATVDPASDPTSHA